MKFILATISVLFINLCFTQETVRYYKLEELANASEDSVIAIDLKKMNLTSLPEEIYRFKNLQYLNLSKNRLSDLSGLTTFKQLKYLNIEKNKLPYFPIAVCQLYEIETLILNRNAFETIPPCIEYCQKLKVLDIWGTFVTGLPEEMTRIKTLEYIDFSGIQINQNRQNQLREMFPTTKLDLSPPCNCQN